MDLDNLSAQIAVAIIGGFAVELLHWYSLSRTPGEIEKYKVHAIYWITSAGMIALGGIMPLLYLKGSASALLCFHLGAATPLILQKLIANLPAVAARQGPSSLPTWRGFFGW
jgi:hypothetical protein